MIRHLAKALYLLVPASFVALLVVTLLGLGGCEPRVQLPAEVVKVTGAPREPVTIAEARAYRDDYNAAQLAKADETARKTAIDIKAKAEEAATTRRAIARDIKATTNHAAARIAAIQAESLAKVDALQAGLEDVEAQSIAAQNAIAQAGAAALARIESDTKRNSAKVESLASAAEQAYKQTLAMISGGIDLVAPELAKAVPGLGGAATLFGLGSLFIRERMKRSEEVAAAEAKGKDDAKAAADAAWEESRRQYELQMRRVGVFPVAADPAPKAVAA